MPHNNVIEALEPWRSKAWIGGHFGVCVRTVERWMFAGCPSRLIGGVRRFRLSEVDGFLQAESAQRVEVA